MPFYALDYRKDLSYSDINALENWEHSLAIVAKFIEKYLVKVGDRAYSNYNIM